jgi:hypothetical protein
MHKAALSIVFIVALLLVIAFSLIGNLYLTISDAIYAITGLIILWYSYETALMRTEITKQNKMQLRPVINLRLANSAVSYKNDGSGPALNVRVAGFKPTILGKPSNDAILYEIQPVSYIVQGGDAEMIIHTGDKRTGAKGTIPDTDMFFGVGKQVQLTILYQDIEGTEYASMITTKTDRVSDISLKYGRERTS